MTEVALTLQQLPMHAFNDTSLDSHNICYVNPFVRRLRSPPLPEPLHSLTRGSAEGQTEAGDIIVWHIQQFGEYTATKLVTAEAERFQVRKVAQFGRHRPAQLVDPEGQLFAPQM